MQYSEIKNYDNDHDTISGLSEIVIGLTGDLKDVFEQTKQVADYPISVTLLGETGTGKEVIARLIHNLSSRKNKPFIKINCGAIPDNLLESELFGYEKGAFTGAHTSKPGKIESAHEGTLFLDEIGEMKLDLQVKLLRVLQEKEIERVGSNEIKQVDFRLICATNRNLKEDIRHKLFREDLYYRITTFPIYLPPLRERKHDLRKLITYFLNKYARKLKKTTPILSPDALLQLLNYQWAGNIRELQNVLQRAIINVNQRRIITVNDLDFLNSCEDNYNTIINAISNHIIAKKIPIKEIEKDILENILIFFDGNKLRASRETLISKDRFYRLH